VTYNLMQFESQTQMQTNSLQVLLPRPVYEKWDNGAPNMSD